jgi:hypothetical protein
LGPGPPFLSLSITGTSQTTVTGQHSLWGSEGTCGRNSHCPRGRCVHWCHLLHCQSISMVPTIPSA